MSYWNTNQRNCVQASTCLPVDTIVVLGVFAVYGNSPTVRKARKAAVELHSRSDGIEPSACAAYVGQSSVVVDQPDQCIFRVRYERECLDADPLHHLHGVDSPMDRFKKLRAPSHQIPRPSIVSFLPRSSSEEPPRQYAATHDKAVNRAMTTSAIGADRFMRVIEEI